MLIYEAGESNGASVERRFKPYRSSIQCSDAVSIRSSNQGRDEDRINILEGELSSLRQKLSFAQKDSQQMKRINKELLD